MANRQIMHDWRGRGASVEMSSTRRAHIQQTLFKLPVTEGEEPDVRAVSTQLDNGGIYMRMASQTNEYSNAIVLIGPGGVAVYPRSGENAVIFRNGQEGFETIFGVIDHTMIDGLRENIGPAPLNERVPRL